MYRNSACEVNIMQIARYWRMQSQRYGLRGVRYSNGEVSLQARHCPPSTQAPEQGLKNPVETKTVGNPVLKLVKPAVA